MCLVVIGRRIRSDYPLVLATNRDEFFDRPAASARFWPGNQDILAGWDERSGGTWAGVSRSGRLAVLTNIRDPKGFRPSAASRGHLVREFLQGRQDIAGYMRCLISTAHAYNSFNLLFGWLDELYCFASRGKRLCRLGPGIHGLSNGLINEPWPKVQRGVHGLSRLLHRREPPGQEELFSLLADDRQAEPNQLPDTGMGPEWERFLSPVFIRGREYGTRNATLLLLDASGRVHFRERRFSRQDHARGAPRVWSAPETVYTLTPPSPPGDGTCGAGGILPACRGSTW
ncbi:MAG: NRDE family protein [Desulfohalobiaceae bacterium]|nr:NRDE family protein [Desulfohalobiaceae bacterium]